MNVHETLDAAADYIERHGWFSHLYGSPSNDFASLCMGNAIGACASHDVHVEAYAAVIRALGCTDPVKHQVIWRWNDAPGRTKEEVVAMLRAVAMSERAREIRAEVALAHEQIRVIA